jgi:hypothetical protein
MGLRHGPSDRWLKAAGAEMDQLGLELETGTPGRLELADAAQWLRGFYVS